MPSKKPVSKGFTPLRALTTLLLLLAAGVVLARNWATARASIHTASHASIAWLVISLLLMAATFAVAAAIYGVLALHRLKYRQTLLVEVSTAFVNRLLPSGIGGLGLHGLYLYKRKHTTADAVVVVSVNNLLGMVGHILLLVALVLYSPATLTHFRHGGVQLHWWMLALVVALVVATVAIPWVRRKLVRFVHNLLASVRKLRLRKLLGALVLAMLLTVTYTAILLSVCRAISVQLSVLQVFVVFSIGMLTSTATPTPGGLVGAEAGLFAGFVAYGVASPVAGAAVLLYRLVTYWLPLVPGVVALAVARRNKLV